MLAKNEGIAPLRLLLSNRLNMVSLNKSNKNHYKNKEEAFQYIAKKVSQKKVWIYYKGKALEIIKIREIINLINKVTPEKYHLLFQGIFFLFF